MTTTPPIETPSVQPGPSRIYCAPAVQAFLLLSFDRTFVAWSHPRACAYLTFTGRSVSTPISSHMPLVNTERASEQYYRDVLTQVLKELGWKNKHDGPPAPGTDIVWSEDPVRKPRLLALPHGCRTNRFFAMVRVCRKVCLAVLLDACTRLHPAHFAGLAPRTWWVGKAAIEGFLMQCHANMAAAVIDCLTDSIDPAIDLSVTTSLT